MKVAPAPAAEVLGRAPGNRIYEPRLRWLRAYPEPIPLDRSYVCDAYLEALVIERGQYGRALRAAGAEGYVLVEWDMALDPGDCRVFEDFVLEQPERIAVAPYALWNVSTSPEPVLACWRASEGVLHVPEAAWQGLEGPLRDVAHQEALRLESMVPYYQEIGPDEAECDQFGFGLIWLPPAVLELAWRERLDRELFYPNADSLFSWWCRDKGLRARVCWSCQPKHVHW